MVSPTYMNAGALDPSSLSRTAWMNDSMMMDEPVDFSKPMYGFDNYGNFDHTMMVDTMVLSTDDPMMPDWNNPNELDFNNFIQNPIGA